jgi:hypothetical protein
MTNIIPIKVNKILFFSSPTSIYVIENKLPEVASLCGLERNQGVSQGRTPPPTKHADSDFSNLKLGTFFKDGPSD